MSTLKTKNIDASLVKKGFVKTETDHTYYTFYLDNKKTSIYTKISHGEKEISEDLIQKMAKQTGLSKKQFLDLVKCPLSKEEYTKLMIDKGKIIQ